MSKRRRTAPAETPATDHGRESGPMNRLPAQLALLAAVLALTVGIAELAGAASLGISFGIGQIAFAIGLVVLLTRA